MNRLVFAIAACIALAICALILWPMLARAEAPADPRLAWIHANVPNCCNHLDCAPARATMTFTGWRVEGADNVIPFAEVIRWPFAVPYACIVGRHARCLLMDGGT